MEYLKSLVIPEANILGEFAPHILREIRVEKFYKICLFNTVHILKADIYQMN